MFKKSLYTWVAILIIGSQTVYALDVKETARYFNGPTVSAVGDTSASLSLSQAVLSNLTPEEKAGIYFQYHETQQVCIMIYPTPESCLPKKTEVGKTNVTLTSLKPSTSYTVVYKRDNTIRCITTPCPGNDFESVAVEFVTQASGTGSGTLSPLPVDVRPILTGFGFKSRGADVITLQTVLLQQGYMTGSPTGYFGTLTLKALKDFQKAHAISPTGFVGPLTRGVLATMTASTLDQNGVAETFEGTVTAYSTQCFADGECSITVDGKKVVTTIGWSQKIVGKVLGIPDFGSIEQNVGAHAKVYAKKTDNGYTLYGSAAYYVLITPLAKGKLSSGSVVTSAASVQGSTWVWQKTVAQDGAVVVPQKIGVFNVTFGTDGSLSGATDCNRFFGTATFGSDGFIKAGPLGSTRMFCEGSQEGVFTGALQDIERYTIDASGSLVLTLSGNKGTMYFVKK